MVRLPNRKRFRLLGTPLGLFATCRSGNFEAALKLSVMRKGAICAARAQWKTRSRLTGDSGSEPPGILATLVALVIGNAIQRIKNRPKFRRPLRNFGGFEQERARRCDVGISYFVDLLSISLSARTKRMLAQFLRR